MKDTKEEKRTDRGQQIIRRVATRYIRVALRYRMRMSAMIALNILVPVVELAYPFLTKRLFTNLTLPKDSAVMHALFVTLALIAAVQLLRWGMQRICVIIANRFQVNVSADIIEQGSAHVLAQSHRFFTESFAGSIAKKIHRDGRAFLRITDDLAWRLTPAFVSIVGAMVLVTFISPVLTAVLSVWFVIYIACNWWFVRWKAAVDEKLQAADTEAGGVIIDAISNSATVLAHATEEDEQIRLRRVQKPLRSLQIRSWDLENISDAGQGLLYTVCEIGMLAYAIVLYGRGLLTLADFAFLQATLLLLFGKLWDVGRVLHSVYLSLVEASEMQEVYDTIPEVRDVPRAKPLRVTHGTIDMHHVGFMYGRARSILRDLDLHIAPHEKVALVGPSGAGKSTIVKLLLRFYNIDKGMIAIDGQDIAEVTQRSLRRNIAFVPQDPALFHRSVLENIRYGSPRATEREVIRAAKQAHADAFIRRLPKGYATKVGERGVKLSGGERQRVAIARAILKNAPILVLDEATSSLDSESEHYIQDALRVLMQDKTVLVIAHRLSTVMAMDRIIVMERGQVSETGTHAELLRMGGMYATLWNIQAGGFLP